MAQKIKTINLSLPFKLGSVNCYLIKADTGFVLIDTGSSNARQELERELENARCFPGDLKLILITHGDFDHIGNAVYLREKYVTKIAMHSADVPIAEHGDMLANRKNINFFSRMIAFLVPRLMRFGKSERFTPDILLYDGDHLSEFALDARVISIPGHSSGSIGILTAGGDLLCGDLFENTVNPGLGSIMDDLTSAQASVEKLKGFTIATVYPGHGKPFPMTLLNT